MVSIAVIALFGLALAALNRVVPDEEPRPGRASGELPDDVWAAFEAAAGGAQTDIGTPSAVAVVAAGRRTTIGGLDEDHTGWVDRRAASIDTDGTVWLDAAAVVHPSPSEGRLRVIRSEEGYVLQDPGPDLPVVLDDKRVRTSVPVVRLIT